MGQRIPAVERIFTVGVQKFSQAGLITRDYFGTVFKLAYQHNFDRNELKRKSRLAAALIYQII